MNPFENEDFRLFCIKFKCCLKFSNIKTKSKLAFRAVLQLKKAEVSLYSLVLFLSSIHH